MSSSPTPDVVASAGRSQSLGRILPTAARNQQPRPPAQQSMSPARSLTQFRHRLQSQHRPHPQSQLFKRKRHSVNSQWSGQTIQDPSRKLRRNLECAQTSNGMQKPSPTSSTAMFWPLMTLGLQQTPSLLSKNQQTSRMAKALHRNGYRPDKNPMHRIIQR